jgi:hypothetical protein
MTYTRLLYEYVYPLREVAIEAHSTPHDVLAIPQTLQHTSMMSLAEMRGPLHNQEGRGTQSLSGVL